MSILYPEGRKAAIEYVGDASIILDELGSGTDGIVFATAHSSAVKVYREQVKFEKELRAYLRLRDHHVTYIRGHAVPQLIGHDRMLRVIEMSWVKPPYIIDFAKTQIDEPIDFEPEAIEMWKWDVRERFGRDAGAVWFIHQELWRKHGIYYHDLKPENIRFADQS